MASNSAPYGSSYLDSLYPGAGTANRLNPFGTTNAPAPQQPIAFNQPPNISLPSWLMDLSARGLGGDWAPAAQGKPEELQLHPRVVPTDEAPNTAPGAGSGADGIDMNGPITPAAYQAATLQAGDAAHLPQSVLSPQAGIQGGGDGGGDSGGGGDAGGGGDSGGGGDAGGGGDSGGGYKTGGVITKNHLLADAPDAPGDGDDGFASVKLGEGVITAKAMKHYGPAFLARINKLAVPKGATG